MTQRSDIQNGLFEDHYKAIVRVVMCHDNVHRKNPGFGKQSLKRSGFSKCMTEILRLLPSSCKTQILGDLKIADLTEDVFINNFVASSCQFYVNYHDDKMCTVEFTAKFESDIKSILGLPDHLLSALHLEVLTPVGSVQV